MPSPFPGMDPFLEHPERWPGVHLLLIAELVKTLNPQLRPKYVVAVEVRMYETSGEQSLLVGIPDAIVKRQQTPSDRPESTVAVAAPPIVAHKVAVPMPEMIRQGYLEVREVGTEEVVTAIELLSPVNKRAGQGRQTYEKKRLEIFGSSTHFVEIDLLRGWKPMPVLNNDIKSDYRILVSRGECRPEADLYAFNLQQSMPEFQLPLRSGDVEPVIDLHSLINAVYDQGGYDIKIDYNQENPVPQLSEADAAWTDTLVRDRGLRES